MREALKHAKRHKGCLDSLANVASEAEPGPGRERPGCRTLTHFNKFFALSAGRLSEPAPSLQDYRDKIEAGRPDGDLFTKAKLPRPISKL